MNALKLPVRCLQSAAMDCYSSAALPAGSSFRHAFVRSSPGDRSQNHGTFAHRTFREGTALRT